MQLFKENIRGGKQLLLNVAKHHFGNSIDEETLRSSLHLNQPEKDIISSEDVGNFEHIIQLKNHHQFSEDSDEESMSGVLSDKESTSQVTKSIKRSQLSRVNINNNKTRSSCRINVPRK